MSDTIVETSAPVGDAGVFDAADAVTRPSRESPRLDPGEVVGRYVVLAQLGAGGMGVVYAAYDPELDRKVALKLLHEARVEGSTQTRARERLLREAQALARFSHPEIVGVHDVGEHEGRVFIAMEFVEGRTLRAFVGETRRSWRELVPVMLAAARGVAAAHAAGLVHRDLKPDNIMVGIDGRVRVMDFGLTRAQGEIAVDGPEHSRPNRELLASPLTQAGSMIGTPAYMAPEQFSGAEVTAATDQFAFCLTAWELLFGERPYGGRSVLEIATAVLEGERKAAPRGHGVPAWLRRAIERGLAVEPSLRWPTMDALIAELERGQRRLRRRVIAIASAVVAGCVTLGFAGRAVADARAVATCEREAAIIDESWNDESRRSAVDAMSATAVGFAASSAELLVPHLDRSAEEWRSFRTDVCVAAEVEGRLPPERYERALFCLEQGRLEFDSLVGRLVAADAEVARTAVRAAASLESMAPCADEGVLSALPDPPPAGVREEVQAVREALAEARIAAVAGKPGDGVKIVVPAREQAQSIGYAPLLASAFQHEAQLLEATGHYAEAEEAATSAYFTGATSRAWGIAADAAVQVVGIAGHHAARPADARVWARHAEIAISMAGDPLGLREALRINNLALALDTAGQYEEAKGLYERSIAVIEGVLGPDHPELAPHVNNLASAHKALGDSEQAEALYSRSLAIRERTLGADHPDVAAALNNLAVLYQERGEVARAHELYSRALEIAERALGPEHPQVASALANLGQAEKRLGRRAEARALYERALSIQERALGTDHPSIASVSNNLGALAYDDQRFADAVRWYERALAIWEGTVGTRHANVASCLTNLGYAEQAAGDYPAAKQAFERASAIWADLSGEDHPDVAYVLESLGDLEFNNGRPGPALEIYERAVAIFDAHEGEQPSEADARFGLARALGELRREPERALEQAELARSAHADAGRTARVERIDAWLAERFR